MIQLRLGQSWRYHEVFIVLSLGFISLVCGRIPLVGWFFYPFQIFGVFVHELSHGLAAVLTGGAFQRFVVNPDLSGTASSIGGIQWVIASAGYVGSALFGGLLTILSSLKHSSRGILYGLGLLLGALCLLFVRNIFGITSGLLLSIGLILIGRYVRQVWADGLLLFLAVQMMLNALNSLFDLILLSTSLNHVTTDAAIMTEVTGIPAVFWALLWTGVSLGCLVGTFSLAYRCSAESL